MKIKSVLIIIWLNIKILYFRLIGKSLFPYKILIQLTNQCNSKCSTCNIWKINNNQSLNLDYLSKFLNQVGVNIYWIALGGGEPTLFHQFSDLLLLLQNSCPNLTIITFTTNGQNPKLVLQQARLIKQMNISYFITISLDGDEKTHNFIRGSQNSYHQAYKTFNLLRSNNISCHFGLTISEHNTHFIHNKLANYIESIRAFTIVHSDGIFKCSNSNLEKDRTILENIKQVNDYYKIRSLGEILVKVSIKISFWFLKYKRSENIIPCEVLATSLHLYEDGSIRPCAYLPSIGNLNDKDIKQKIYLAQNGDLAKKIQMSECSKCWMNCYAPHAMMLHPLLTIKYLIKRIK